MTARLPRGRLSPSGASPAADAGVPEAAHDSAGLHEPVRPRRRTYTDADKVAALRVLGECGGHLSRASRRLGIDVSLLHRWRLKAAARERG